jgi:A/G-specific adenine glycosylase
LRTTKGKQKKFTGLLMRWHRDHNTRSLPWKEEHDPYKIWLSEIILQQTRAAQGLPYYEKFVAAYPDVEALAAAPDDEVFKLWEGLGYYSRCRNLLAAARFIAGERQGNFPDSYEDILHLTGVGPYTAAAVASFAFGLPHAVVDGNVYRVLARVFGLFTPTDSSAGKREFQSLADALLDLEDPGGFNQAMMDLGATVCLPQSPRCLQCPLESFCTARQQQLIDALPVHAKKTAVRTRCFHYVLMLRNGEVWLRQRKGRDIWRGLYEPFLIEADAPLDSALLRNHEAFRFLSGVATAPEFIGAQSQRLTHQLIHARFFVLRLPRDFTPPEDGVWVRLSGSMSYALPRVLKSFFEKMATFK